MREQTAADARHGQGVGSYVGERSQVLTMQAPPVVARSPWLPEATMISGKTTLIAHLGYPTEAFKAPMIYNPWFDSKGIDAVVVPMGVKPEDYAATLKPIFKFTNLRGALVTMPHKVTTVAPDGRGHAHRARSPAPATRSCCAPTARCSATSSTAPASCAACSARASSSRARACSSPATAASAARSPLAGRRRRRPRWRCTTRTTRRRRRWPGGCASTTRSCRSRPAPTTRPATT